MESIGIEERFVIETAQRSAVHVFLTMLDRRLNPEKSYAEGARAMSLGGVTAQISLVGACSINSLMNCSESMACSIASALLMMECPTVDEEVLDAMAEMANMVMGNVKTDLEGQLGETNLSIPTVMFGRDFAVHNSSQRWVVLPFAMEGEVLSVRLCFESASGSKTRQGASEKRSAVQILSP